MLEHAEAHHVAVEVHPAVHLAPADVAHHVVDVLQPHRPRDRVFAFHGAEAGQEGAADSCGARRRCEWYRHRSRWRRCALRRARRADVSGSRTLRAPRCVVSRHAASASSTHSAISCTPSPCSRMCSAMACSGRERRGQHEADLVLLPARRKRGRACRFPGRGRPPAASRSRAIVIRRLPRVAHVELHVVGAVQRQEILAQPAVGDAPDACGITPPQCLDAQAGCLRRCRWKCAGNCGSPNAFSGRTTTPCASSSSKMRVGLLRVGQHQSSRNSPPTAPPSAPAPRALGKKRRPRAFNSSERCRNSLSASAAIPAACAGVRRLERQLHLQQIARSAPRARTRSRCARPPGRRFSKTCAA